ncbi:MAG: hypothetical protein ACRCTK_05200 [Alphaproteobacteria bacterium]
MLLSLLSAPGKGKKEIHLGVGACLDQRFLLLKSMQKKKQHLRLPFKKNAPSTAVSGALKRKKGSRFSIYYERKGLTNN